MKSIHLAQDREQRWSREHCNEPLGSTQDVEFLD